jgi:hypothetical protein
MAGVSGHCSGPEEHYYDVEENTYIRIIRTVICEATDINPGNINCNSVK